MKEGKQVKKLPLTLGQALERRPTGISQTEQARALVERLPGCVVQRLAEMIFSRMAYGYVVPRVIPTVDNEKFTPVRWTPVAEVSNEAMGWRLVSAGMAMP